MLVVKNLSYLYNDLNRAIMGELESIWLEAEKHLHHSLLVCIDHTTVLSLAFQRTLADVQKTCKKLCLIVFGFPFLYNYYVFHSLDDVELLDVDPKFALLDLGEVQHVLNHELEAERAGLLHLDSIVQLTEREFAVHHQQACLDIIFDFFLELG